MPMNDRLIEACALALERHLEMLFENPVKIPNTGMCELPVVGNLFIPDLEPDYSEFFPMIIAALAARERFRQDAPGWPTLPLHERDIELLKNDDRPQVQVVGLFGDSWKYAGWDKRHPCFDGYVSGLMFYDHTPDEIRNDRSLLKEFPPLPLAGLCGGTLHWRSPEKLAFDLERQAARDAFMARERRDAPR
jgi:hypothetical protein